MIIHRILMLLCSIIFLLSCGSFENDGYNIKALANAYFSEPMNKEVIEVYVNNAESELLIMQQQNSAKCISGQLAIAQRYVTRANAEKLAGMEKDVFITLVAFDRQIRKIRCINKYINGQLGCGITNQKTILKRWYAESNFNECNTISPIKKGSTSELQVKKTATVESQIATKHDHIFITETLYDVNQDQIKPIYYEPLNKLVAVIKSFPKSTLLISSYTDSLGNIKYNNQLRKKRASNVKQYFIDNGINPARIILKDKGEASIREIEKSNASRVFNRYTSITLLLDTHGHSNI